MFDLHNSNKIFVVHFSKQAYNANDMNYEKVQKYLKSLQNAGVTDLNDYQNYINSAKLNRRRSMVLNRPPHMQSHPQHYPMPIYAPPSGSTSYMTNARMFTLPHSFQSNFYQDYYCTHDERKSPRHHVVKSERQKKSVKEDVNNLSYTGVDRDLAESYLKSIEVKDHHHM